jgi:prepilin-type N-terminal cleavage/methylation domain-containing protein
MPVLTRRGFTMVELLIALVLLGIVSGAIYQVLVNNQRVYQAQTQQIDLQQNLRAASSILPAEFRELDAREGDIQAMSATSIQIRAMRKLAFICSNVPGLGAGTVTLTYRQTPSFPSGVTFNLGDSVLVFYEGNPAKRDDDHWLLATATSRVAGFCLNDIPATTPGYVLTLQANWANADTLKGISRGSPIRAFEVIQYRQYQAADGKYYLGYQNLTSGGSIQPLIGPLAGSAGLEFDYYDSTGTATALPAQVAMIAIHVRSQTAQAVRSQGATGTIAVKVDSITTRVALRNNPRCGPCK